jgi:hypothetical protein
MHQLGCNCVEVVRCSYTYRVISSTLCLQTVLATILHSAVLYVGSVENMNPNRDATEIQVRCFQLNFLNFLKVLLI